jgi:cell division protein YceG involved in septum cleavage
MDVKINCGKGVDNLSADDKLVIDKIVKEYENKIVRHGEKIDVFEVHLKCHQKDGKSKRYNIETKLYIGTFRFETSADDWNLVDALHSAMKKLLSEIEHKVTRVKEDKTWKKKARI